MRECVRFSSRQTAENRVGRPLSEEVGGFQRLGGFGEASSRRVAGRTKLGDAVLASRFPADAVTEQRVEWPANWDFSLLWRELRGVCQKLESMRVHARWVGSRSLPEATINRKNLAVSGRGHLP